MIWTSKHLTAITNRLPYFYCSTCGAVLSIAAAMTMPASALTLSDALDLARRTDPQFRSAQANQLASHERSKQAFGALLPQLSLAINTTVNQRTYETKNSTQPPADDIYNSNSAQLSLTQHLWHSASRIAVTQADASFAQARYQLALAEQDLLVRLAQAWFDTMNARDTDVFSARQQEATQYQWEQARRAAENGLASGPMLEEARTKYDQALAEQVGAETELSIKLAALEQITGSLTLIPNAALPIDYLAKDPGSKTLEQWLADAEENNPAVLAAINALYATNEEIRKQEAGHEPTLDATATYGHNGQTVGSFPGQNGYDIHQLALGLQLNIPLYSGGTQNAKVREAIAMRDKAEQDLESAKRNARLQVKQAWFSWQAGFARQSAALQAKKFTTLSLLAASKGKISGVKTELDVLQSRQQLASATRDVHKAHYEMITSYLKLQASVGHLVDTDLTSLDTWLEPNEARR